MTASSGTGLRRGLRCSRDGSGSDGTPGVMRRLSMWSLPGERSPGSVVDYAGECRATAPGERAVTSTFLAVARPAPSSLFAILKSSQRAISGGTEMDWYDLEDEDVSPAPRSVDDDLARIAEREEQMRGAFDREPSPARLRTLRAMPYSEYLRTPEWRAKRSWMLQIENYTCERCGCRAPDHELHVHHRTYENRGREYVQDLLLLCSVCHANEHGIEAA